MLHPLLVLNCHLFALLVITLPLHLHLDEFRFYLGVLARLDLHLQLKGVLPVSFSPQVLQFAELFVREIRATIGSVVALAGIPVVFLFLALFIHLLHKLQIVKRLVLSFLFALRLN